MKLAKGPRPWPIRLFVGVFLLTGIASYVQMMTRLDIPLSLNGFDFDPENDRELLIVVLSAQLTIVAIPLAMIWFLASNVARWLVTFMALATLPRLVMLFDAWSQIERFEGFGLILPALNIAALVLLFTPPARRWFAKD